MAEVRVIIELRSGRYFGVCLRGEAPKGYCYLWWDGPHHQFAIGPICFVWSF